MQVLWNSDQLHRACDQGEVFTGFSEGLLLFPPTYKFDVGTDNYDSSAKVRLWTSPLRSIEPIMLFWIQWIFHDHGDFLQEINQYDFTSTK